MAQIYKPAKKAVKKTPKDQFLEIEGVDYQGQGVCRQHNPVVFVEGGLPGETCNVSVKKQKKNYWLGQAKTIQNKSPHRVKPVCDYFGHCGGCQTQHVDAKAMLEFKRKSIEYTLKQALDADKLTWQPDIVSEPIGYRRKCRLAIDARNKQAVLVGFRSKDSKQVSRIDACPVLAPELNVLLIPIQQLVRQMEAPQCLGHIGLLKGDNLTQISLRIIKKLGRQDESNWITLANNAGCQLVAEYSDGRSVVLNQQTQSITISPDSTTSLDVTANDFIQINDQVNKQMVEQAMQWLVLDKQDKVLDLFCGLGNFSLPIAKQVESVVGIEGVPDMVQRAAQNALKNGIGNCRFVSADLAQKESLKQLKLKGFDKVLLDPARDGALSVMPQLAALKPSRVVYVSCNPSTFARDARELSAYKYRLEKISLMDMFPNTAHTELMALFVPVSD